MKTRGQKLIFRMEDWYLALTAASALQPTTTEVFSERDMQGLVDTIDTEPDPIPMRWLNAIFGRVFFGLYRTEALEQVRMGLWARMGVRLLMSSSSSAGS